MTLHRVAGQLLDSERSCVVPDCGSHAVAEDFQTTLPGKADQLERKAAAFERLAREARDEAAALRAEIEAAQPRAFICAGHRQRLPRDLVVHWEPVPSYIGGMPAAGRLADDPGSDGEADAIAGTLADLEANPPPWPEPRPQPVHNVHRLPRAPDLADA